MKAEDRIRELDEARLALLDEMDATDPEKLVARPIEGKWSMLEILEHLALAERAVLRGLPDPASLEERPRRPRHRIRYPIVMFVLTYGIPVRVPSPAMEPQGSRDLAEVRRLWDESQAWLRRYVDGLDARDRRRNVFTHPIAGPMNVEQAVRMARVHLGTHLRQIRRLQRLLA